MDSAPTLAQALGCLGAYANTEMADDTDCILIPKSMSRDICQSVEQYYNSSRATQFNIPFILLEDLQAYIMDRAQQFPDPTFLSLISIK
jgi:inner membrane protein involved in colicin E2 resistance